MLVVVGATQHPGDAMHAIRQYAFGPAENLLYEQVDDPVPGDDQVRIVVEAAGVHLVDTTIRRGESGGPFPVPHLPMIPGREVAGRVDALGPGAAERWLGRRVVAHLGLASGGYAELAVAAATSLHEIPDRIAADAAVAMIGTGRTAMGILEVAEITARDTVLVTSAAGGLGTLLIQAARNAGAVAVGVAGGPHKLERVRQLGADVAVDYGDPGWPAAVRDALGDRDVTVVLDGVGGSIGRGALELLGAAGRIVLFGMSSGELLPLDAGDLLRAGLTATGALGPRMQQRPGGIRGLEAASLAEASAGRLVPVITSFTLAEAAKAHTALEARATVGKTVLLP